MIQMVTESRRIKVEAHDRPKAETRGSLVPELLPQPTARPWALLEFLAYFGIGFAVMNFIYLHPEGRGWAELGAPGFDSFYHIKMAVLMPELGLVDDFPWLQHVWFTQYDSNFVSHHYGFHVLLMPFVHGAKALGYDYLTGGRWGIATFFGISLALMMGILISERVRWRWLWIAVFLVLPSEFFWRHSYVRAIAPSLMFMLMIVWAMFRDRPKLAALATAGYAHLYLGSVVYSPVIVGCYVAGCMVGPRGDRSIPWRMVLWTTLGWLVGLRTYPYFGGALEFLRMQIFGSGLDPDIAVGAEWSSYGNVWEFASRLCGPLLVVWAACLTLRLRFGARLSGKEISLVLMNFAFLLLTLKAKRFIEYWPAFCLLSSIFLVTPLVNRLAAWFDGDDAPRSEGWAGRLRRSVPVAICAAGLAAFAVAWQRGPLAAVTFWIESPIWVITGTALLLSYLGPVWFEESAAARIPRATAIRIGGLLLSAALFAGLLKVLVRHGLGGPSPRSAQLDPGVLGWVGLAVLVGILAWRRRNMRSGRVGEPPIVRRMVRSGVAVSAGLLVVAAVVLSGSNRLAALQRDIGTAFDLPSVRDALGYLAEVSEPGDIVFTDDWDCFPVYFYHNSKNRYIVGLDPMFTHTREPETWERFVKITRGQVPRTYQASWTGPDGVPVRRELTVKLTDIRDHFRAKYVIVDSDHGLLAKKLAEAGDFAELIYPKPRYADCEKAPYLIFRVKDAGEPVTAGEPEPAPDGSLYLGSLKPEHVQQGWGDLTLDRSVDGEPIHLGSQFHERGLGTHAPLELTYRIPPGYTAFETVVGLNRICGDRGSVVVAVEVDGREVYRSRVLRGGQDPVVIRAALDGAEYLTLRADTTTDGDKWDHVDWGSARLTNDSDGSARP